MEYATLGEEGKDYVIATEEASLVWLANLACLELHQAHARRPRFDKPDYIVYDFDPPEGCSFPEVTGLALEFKSRLEELGYHPFVKTTGRKGLHVLTPIEPKWSFDEAFEAAKKAAQPFVEARPETLTLQIRKDQRKGRVLLDIYRNRPQQTIVAAYSLRGLPGAPVSAPLEWDELETLKDPRVFNMESVPGRLKEKPDPWEAFAAFATRIHTASPARAKAPKALAPSRSHKTPKQLETYSAKRRFSKTPEPPGETAEPAEGSTTPRGSIMICVWSRTGC
jgi:bifunctional non-homologous end joining protein LigD